MPNLSPLVDQIVKEIQRRIRSGEYLEGQKLPPEREIAAEFRVSRMIVRNAISHLSERGVILCSPRCRPIVQRVGGPKRAYDADRHNIALSLWHSPSNPGGHALLHGIHNEIDHDRYRVMLSSVVGSTWKEAVEAEAQFLSRASHDRDLAGIILWYIGGESNRWALEEARDANVPIVFVDREPPQGFHADFVGVDNRHAACQVVTHLIEQGHRRIAHLSNIDSASTVGDRMAGYLKALAAVGLKPEPEWILREERDDVDPSPWFDWAVQRIMDMRPRPTAVFAINDLMAFHFLEACQRKGVHVPGELSVAGFDGVERFGRSAPFLTTASQPFERIGSLAVEVLLRRIASGPYAPWRFYCLDAPLTISESTRAPDTVNAYS